jgi:SAM-dependent methyltransferase
MNEKSKKVLERTISSTVEFTLDLFQRVNQRSLLVRKERHLERLLSINRWLARLTADCYSRLRELESNVDVRRKHWSGICETFSYMAGLFKGHEEVEFARQILASQIEPEERFLIPRFQRCKNAPLNTWTYQNEIMNWDIRPGERVLDIGSGGWPFRKSTHLADMFTGETSHRYEALRRDKRPFVVLDICHMPFADRQWDFTFCSHVLEHLNRPGDAIRELVRVSQRGYIEVPTRLSDVMLNFTRLKNHHRWHALVLGDTLLLIEWRVDERRDLGTSFFYSCLHSKYKNEFQDLFEKNWDLFYGMLKWEGGIKFLIIDCDGKIVDRSTHDKEFH